MRSSRNPPGRSAAMKRSSTSSTCRTRSSSSAQSGSRLAARAPAAPGSGARSRARDARTSPGPGCRAAGHAAPWPPPRAGPGSLPAAPAAPPAARQAPLPAHRAARSSSCILSSPVITKSNRSMTRPAEDGSLRQVPGRHDVKLCRLQPARCHHIAPVPRPVASAGVLLLRRPPLTRGQGERVN
jgi:hypothetical protein